MPNWVYNYITVSGPNQEELDKFAKHIQVVPEFYELDEGETDMGNRFSFHSFITLDVKHKEEYHTTNGFGPEGKTGDTEFNWYNWNNANWNTKWDACDSEVDINPHSITLRFNTAWSPPDPVFAAMSEMFPSLTFDIEWEEEQGFGAQLVGDGGQVTIVKQWDSPSCHQDYVDRDNEDGCLCAYYENSDDWFEDCPGKRQPNIYQIEIVHKFNVEALSEEDAIQAVEAHENNYDLADNVKIIDYEYNADYRCVGEQEKQEEE